MGFFFIGLICAALSQIVYSALIINGYEITEHRVRGNGWDVQPNHITGPKGFVWKPSRFRPTPPKLPEEINKFVWCSHCLLTREYGEPTWKYEGPVRREPLAVVHGFQIYPDRVVGHGWDIGEKVIKGHGFYWETNPVTPTPPSLPFPLNELVWCQQCFLTKLYGSPTWSYDNPPLYEEVDDYYPYQPYRYEDPNQENQEPIDSYRTGLLQEPRGIEPYVQPSQLLQDPYLLQGPQFSPIQPHLIPPAPTTFIQPPNEPYKYEDPNQENQEPNDSYRTGLLQEPRGIEPYVQPSQLLQDPYPSQGPQFLPVQPLLIPPTPTTFIQPPNEPYKYEDPNQENQEPIDSYRTGLLQEPIGIEPYVQPSQLLQDPYLPQGPQLLLTQPHFMPPLPQFFPPPIRFIPPTPTTFIQPPNEPYKYEDPNQENQEPFDSYRTDLLQEPIGIDPYVQPSQLLQNPYLPQGPQLLQTQPHFMRPLPQFIPPTIHFIPRTPTTFIDPYIQPSQMPEDPYLSQGPQFLPIQPHLMPPLPQLLPLPIHFIPPPMNWPPPFISMPVHNMIPTSKSNKIQDFQEKPETLERFGDSRTIFSAEENPLINSMNHALQDMVEYIVRKVENDIKNHAPWNLNNQNIQQEEKATQTSAYRSSQEEALDRVDVPNNDQNEHLEKPILNKEYFKDARNHLSFKDEQGRLIGLTFDVANVVKSVSFHTENETIRYVYKNNLLVDKFINRVQQPVEASTSVTPAPTCDGFQGKFQNNIDFIHKVHKIYKNDLTMLSEVTPDNVHLRSVDRTNGDLYEEKYSLGPQGKLLFQKINGAKQCGEL